MIRWLRRVFSIENLASIDLTGATYVPVPAPADEAADRCLEVARKANEGHQECQRLLLEAIAQRDRARRDARHWQAQHRIANARADAALAAAADWRSIAEGVMA